MLQNSIQEIPVQTPKVQTPKETLASWLLQQGLDGASQQDIMLGYCQKLVDLGVPLMRVHMAQRAFHPQFGGLGIDWLREGGVSHQQYELSDSPVTRWLASPLYHLLKQGLGEMRERMIAGDHNSQFPMLNELKSQGATDYFATGLLFEKQAIGAVIDPDNAPEGVMISWTSDGADGFAETDLELIRAAHPYLGLALKSASNRQMAHDLLAVYLGRDAGKRVLSGEIQRGSSQKINAVICYFDLTGFTQLAEQTPGDDLIAMLNDYFAVAVQVIQANGGNILKFMGDGMLTMFNLQDIETASAAALEAATTLRRKIGELNVQREINGLPTTEFTLALHAGDILYGNIGAENRLDFTVIGPAVNLTARLSGMHRTIGRSIIVSDKIYAASHAGRHDLVSLGRYMLRGVSEPQELYTVYEGTS
jgi:adenylate cyclase